MLRITELLKKSEETSLLLPNLLSDSSILSRTILQGLHSTRFSGKGEAFWQFKEYTQGDNIKSIDWRKSAASKKILVREKENETTKVIYFYYDKSKSMTFKSSKILNSKYYVATLISLTLARIFVRNRENVYLFNDQKVPIKCSTNFQNFNNSFVSLEKNNELPNHTNLKNNSSIIILSDFLFYNKALQNFIIKLKSKSINGYLIQILDPLEINFDIGENIQLNDLETGESMVIGDSQNLKKEYIENLKKQTSELKLISKKENWPYLLHSTEKDLKKFLIKIIDKIIINKYKIA